jgi:hypothetical protein
MANYFKCGSIAEEILADTQYLQREKQATNTEIVKALLEVAQYFIECAEDLENER